MKTTAGKSILVVAALALGVARVSLLPAILVWLATAGIVVAVERLKRSL